MGDERPEPCGEVLVAPVDERDATAGAGQFGEAESERIARLSLGPHATDLIHEAVVSIQLENTVEELMRTMHAHPSLAEAVGQANEDVRGLAIDKG